MSCNTDDILYPSTACNEPDGLLETIQLLAKGSYFADSDAAKSQAGWTTKIQAEELIPIPIISGFEDLSEGSQYETNAWGASFVHDGMKAFRIMVDTGSDLHKRLRTLKSSGSFGFLKTYTNGKVKGYNPAGTTEIRGFSAKFINVEYKKENDGSTLGKTPIYFCYKDPAQEEDRPIIVKPTWDPSELEALYSVKLEIVGTPSSTEVVVNAIIDHINPDVSAIGANPVEGLVTADFSFLNSSGTAQTVTATESTSTPGQYTLAGTSLVTGTLNLASPADMTTEGYKSIGSVAVTIA